MAKRDPNAPLAPDPRLTDTFRTDVMAVASALQNKPSLFTDALRDPLTRKEFRTLVRDLFDLAQVITESDPR